MMPWPIKRSGDTTRVAPGLWAASQSRRSRLLAWVWPQISMISETVAGCEVEIIENPPLLSEKRHGRGFAPIE